LQKNFLENFLEIFQEIFQEIKKFFFEQNGVCFNEGEGVRRKKEHLAVAKDQG
jgi:hypothetical protein